jgi:acetyl/propionyl-CoA carboxylase alpha subunit
VIRLRCGDALHEAVVRASKDGLEVTVDGRAFRPVVEAVQPGTFVLRAGNVTFHCVREGDKIHLAWRGQVYTLVQEREGAAAAQRHVAGGLEAPMPGRVIKLSVQPGDGVTKGQELLVVEAMKMENALRAPRDGRVKLVAARLGDTVNPGVVLVEIE